jgi:hypothetical protein
MGLLRNRLLQMLLKLEMIAIFILAAARTDSKTHYRFPRR